jgi:hypothetical protein
MFFLEMGCWPGLIPSGWFWNEESSLQKDRPQSSTRGHPFDRRHHDHLSGGQVDKRQMDRTSGATFVIDRFAP